MDRVVCLSRQKLRLESARDEPDLRKLLAHLCTVEHVEGWIRENPPSRIAPSPAQDLEVAVQEDEMAPSSRPVKTDALTFRHWPTGDLRSTVTVVREVDDDDEADSEDEGEDEDCSEEFWNEYATSDTSEDPSFDLLADEHGLLQSDSSPAVIVCRDFAYDRAKVPQTCKSTPKLLSVAECRELAMMICA